MASFSMASAVFRYAVHIHMHSDLTTQCEYRSSYNVQGFVCVCVCVGAHRHMSEDLGQNILPGFLGQLTHELKVKKMLLLQLGSSNHKSPLGILVWGEGRTTP